MLKNVDGVMRLTAWMFCRECKKFDNGEHSDKPCSGRAFDFIVDDDVKFMESCGYEFDDVLIRENKNDL